LKLTRILKHTGVIDMFSEKLADLSGIAADSKANHLSISKAVHKAVLEVLIMILRFNNNFTLFQIDETGSEAAGATGIELGSRFNDIQEDAFRADHPFLFAIVDVKAKLLLFLGHYYGR